MRILFITGSGRSGSTLLEKLICSSPKFISVGEVRLVGDRGLIGNNYCSCKERFASCPFWTKVIKNISLSRKEIVDAYNKVKQLSRLRNIYKLFYSKERVKGYNYHKAEEFLEKLYSSIHNISDNKIIVDSSKRPAYCALLSEVFGEKLSVIHIVRDSRAVSYSWKKRKKYNQEGFGRDDYMPIRPVCDSSIEWLQRNIISEVTLRYVKESMILKYENICDHTRKMINKASTSIYDEISTVEISNGTFYASPGHSVAGNPLRFEHGRITLSKDNKWVEEMDTCDKLVSTSLTFPFLLKYDYNLVK
jgi:hypothetical protein